MLQQPSSSPKKKKKVSIYRHSKIVKNSIFKDSKYSFFKKFVFTSKYTQHSPWQNFIENVSEGLSHFPRRRFQSQFLGFLRNENCSMFFFLTENSFKSNFFWQFLWQTFSFYKFEVSGYFFQVSVLKLSVKFATIQKKSCLKAFKTFAFFNRVAFSLDVKIRRI